MQPPTSIFFPDFRGELWKVGPLMRALLQDTVDNFQDMQDKSSQEEGEFKRRILYQKKLDNIRHKLTRFYLILAWMNKHHTRIQKLEGLHNVITKSEQSFDNVLKGFGQIAFEFADWCEPEWDVDSAVHILSTGSYRLLPTNIAEQCRFVFDLDEEQEDQVTEGLNRQIRFKLFSSDIPRGLTLKKLEDGMATMEMKGEYRVELSLRMGPQESPPLSDKERVRWSVFDLSIVVRAKRMSQHGEEGDLQEVVNSRQERLLIDFVNQKVRTSRNPLREMHNIIHNFVLQVLMKVIRTQLSIVQTEMGETVHVIRDRKNVVIEMWKREQEEGEEKYELKTEIVIDNANLKISHHPPNPVMRSPEMRARFSLQRAAVYIPEMIRNVTIFYSNDRLFQLIKSLEGTWPERIRVFDNETKLEVPLDSVQTSNSIHYVDVHLFHSFFVRIFVDRFTGKISLEVQIISESYVKKAVSMVNEDNEKLGECLSILRNRAIIRSYQLLANALNHSSLVEAPANHPLIDSPVLFVESQVFPPVYFVFQLKDNEVRVFESRFGKEINKPLEFRLISPSGTFNRANQKQREFDVQESKAATKILNSMEKDEGIPILTTKALTKILSCTSAVNFIELLSSILDKAGYVHKPPSKKKGAKKKVGIEINGEQVEFSLSESRYLAYKHSLKGLKKKLPTFHSTVIHQVARKKGVEIEFSVDIRFPHAVKKLLQLVEDLRIIQSWDVAFQTKDLQGYQLIQTNALPIDFLLRNPSGDVKIQIRPNSFYPFVSVLMKDPPPNLPFLTPLLRNPERIDEFLRLLETTRNFTRKFNETKEAFAAGIQAWRPEFKYSDSWTLEPMSQTHFRIYCSPKRQIEVCPITNETMTFRDHQKFGSSMLSDVMDISKGLTQIFINGSIGSIKDFRAVLDSINQMVT